MRHLKLVIVLLLVSCLCFPSEALAGNKIVLSDTIETSTPIMTNQSYTTIIFGWDGYISFKAPSKGTYVFTFGNMHLKGLASERVHVPTNISTAEYDRAKSDSTSRSHKYDRLMPYDAYYGNTKGSTYSSFIYTAKYKCKMRKDDVIYIEMDAIGDKSGRPTYYNVKVERKKTKNKKKKEEDSNNEKDKGIISNTGDAHDN